MAYAIAALIAAAAVVAGLHASTDVAAAAVCADHPNQASAQIAKDTRDSDGDGVFCETLSCPCLGPGEPAPEPAPAPAPPPESAPPAEPAPAPPAEPAPTQEQCTTTDDIVRVTLDRRRHRRVLAHMRKAIRAGWDRVLVLNREGAEKRRERLLDDDRYPTRDGMDRDEWPMAFARPTWRAHVAYVPSGQNRSAGAIIGNALRPYCDGTAFRVIGGRLPA